MHVHFKEIPVEELRKYGKARFYKAEFSLLILVLVLTVGLLMLGLLGKEEKLVWSVIWTIIVYLLGVGMAGPAISAILLVVKARWSSVAVRIFESFVIVGWLAFFLLWVIWFGKEILFPWGSGEGLPGREFYMQPWFAFLRNGCLLFFYLCYATWFVMKSVRLDIAYILSKNDYHRDYLDWEYIGDKWIATRNFFEQNEKAHRQLCWHAPILILFYAVTMSLFGFEFIMGMDPIWYSNLFGAHYAVTSLYLTWCFGFCLSVNLKQNIKPISAYFDQQFFWDLGKLIFGFAMLWAYFSFSQYLVQWYGNLPEETAWIALRVRDYPWNILMWFVFGSCFVFPFLTLLSQDVKKNWQLLFVPAVAAVIGLYGERFLLIAPSVFGYDFTLTTWNATLIISGFFFSVACVLYFSLHFLSHYPFFAFGRHLFIDAVKKGDIKLVEEFS
ncbi:MAG: hypothetical protein N2654_06890 [Deltaproteobacteria bacterium]|nr:hypothetical protein [Deltaproteobacteria bacterium]